MLQVDEIASVSVRRERFKASFAQDHSQAAGEVTVDVPAKVIS
jgi:hypothetical protein